MRRVVVTGLGAVTPVGNNVHDTWSNLLAGKHGIGPITKFDTTDYKATLAAEVKGFDPLLTMDRSFVRRNDPFCQFAVAASVVWPARSIPSVWAFTSAPASAVCPLCATNTPN